MKNSMACSLLLSVCMAGMLGAQTNRAASMEYLQSSSPLRSGGSVTAYSTPGTGVQTSITANVSSNAPGGSGPGSVIQNQSSAAGNTWIPTDARIAANPLAGISGNPPSPPANGFDPYTSTLPPQIQLPTLGFTQNSSYRPGLFRNSWGQQLPGLPPIEAPAASLAPQINPPLGSGIAPPSLQFPGSSSPLLSGQIPPGVRYQNMPPGVYYGKGVFGQPKAYVDGQPGRNLLRFIFP